jgi:glutamate---cysteine ligase / carboxylate-amine ligase
MGDNYQFGIEEELFLADAVTRATPNQSLDAFHADVHRQFPEVERELMQSQIEIASPPSTSFDEARKYLGGLRSGIAEIAMKHGMLLLASGTHPLAHWSSQQNTDKPRYEAVTQEMQMVARRNHVCGMHVHVEVPGSSDPIDLMNRLMPYLPLLLALSASSPFWQGRNTGLAAYRLSVWGELPRTGLPETFADTDEYERFVDLMVRTGAIKDASFLWWAIRPSRKYPTLELRVADSCTSLDTSIAIAALYRCLVRFAVRNPDLNKGLTGASRAIVTENLWRAQRYGVRATFIDEHQSRAIPCAEFLRTLTGQLAEDADALGCLSEIERATDIVTSGTSADCQIAIADDASGDPLIPVVDWIARTTKANSD